MRKSIARWDCFLEVWFETTGEWQVIWLNGRRGEVEIALVAVMPKVLSLDEQIKMREAFALVDFWKLPNVMRTISEGNAGLVAMPPSRPKRKARRASPVGFL